MVRALIARDTGIDGPAGIGSAGPATPAGSRVENRFHHEAVFYSGEDGFLDATLPFAEDALAAEEPLLVAVGNDRAELLRRALGQDCSRVIFTDMRLLENPARMIPAWRRFLDDNASEDRAVRGIGEPIRHGRSTAEVTECERHESLLNLAFDDGVAWSLRCPYDLDGLEDGVIEAARRSHPFVDEYGGSRASDSYRFGEVVPGPFGGTLPRAPAGAEELRFDGDKVGWLRRRVSDWALGRELGCERTEQLVLAVTELASNSVHHGGGGGTLRMWREQDTLLVEVQDRGHIQQPLIGRTRPGPEQPTGRGLWVVNHVCDLVQIRSASAGSVVRVHMRLG
jgi:anti-sigma regulatory factor (Ser/Thr protein kinase)